MGRSGGAVAMVVSGVFSQTQVGLSVFVVALAEMLCLTLPSAS